MGALRDPFGTGGGLVPPWAIDGTAALGSGADIPGSAPAHYATNFLTGPKAKAAKTPASHLDGGLAAWATGRGAAAALPRASLGRRHFPGAGVALPRLGGGEYAVPAVAAASDPAGRGSTTTATLATPYHLRRTAAGGSGGPAAAAPYRCSRRPVAEPRRPERAPHGRRTLGEPARNPPRPTGVRVAPVASRTAVARPEPDILRLGRATADPAARRRP